MATLLELADFSASADYQTLARKIRAAIAKKAVAIGNLAAPSALQIAWAKEALASPAAVSDVIITYVVAANASATIAQIVGASDAAIETAVGTAVDKVLSI
jgi:hypothetical protein